MNSDESNSKGHSNLPIRMSRLWLFANFAITALIFVGAMIRSGSGSVMPVLIFFFAWDMLPLGGVLWLLKLWDNPRVRSDLALLICIVIPAIGNYAYSDALFFRPSPQTPLALIYLPLFQWLSILVAYLWGRGIRNQDVS